MSTEIIKKIDPYNVSHMLVLSCAPVLAGLKPSALFVTCSSNYDEVVSFLEGTDIEIVVLCDCNNMLKLLIYNRKLLSKCLRRKMNISFMRKLGYMSCNVERVLSEFTEKFRLYQEKKYGFPHEMGIILGYPIEDVNGFMCNNGRNYILSGYWKVYNKPTVAKRIFKAYDDATERMITELVS